MITFKYLALLNINNSFLGFGRCEIASSTIASSNSSPSHQQFLVALIKFIAVLLK